MPRFPDSYYYASGQKEYPSYFYRNSAPSTESYSEYTSRQEVERVSYEDMAPYNSSGSHYYATGQGSDHSYFHEDPAPSKTSHSEYYTGGQEVERVLYEDTIPGYPSFGPYYATGQEDDQPCFYEDLEPSQTSRSEYYTSGQEVEPVFHKTKATKMTSYFKDEGVGLGIMYPDEEENEEVECTFEPQASFFCNVAESALTSLPPAPVPAYYAHVHEYQNADSTPKGNSTPKAFSASSFRDDYLSLYCYNGQGKSVTSGTVTHVNAVEVAQVSEISHVNELTPRDSGGSFTRCLEKAISPKTYSKLFERAGQKLRTRSKQRLESW
ncbi:hypothetical protein ACHAPO_001279 [Fusarium lateritium]